MKKFILHGEMADKFCDEIELDVETIREAFNGIHANFPGFKSFITENNISQENFQFFKKDICRRSDITGIFSKFKIKQSKSEHAVIPFLKN